MATGGGKNESRMSSDLGYSTGHPTSIPENDSGGSFSGQPTIRPRTQPSSQSADTGLLSFPRHWYLNTEELVDAFLKLKGATVELHETVATIIRRLLSHDIAQRTYVKKCPLPGREKDGSRWVQVHKAYENSSLVRNALMLLHHLKNIRRPENQQAMTTEQKDAISGCMLEMAKELKQTSTEDKQFPNSSQNGFGSWEDVECWLKKVEDLDLDVENLRKQTQQNLGNTQKKSKETARNPLSREYDASLTSTLSKLEAEIYWLEYYDWLKAANNWRKGVHNVALENSSEVRTLEHSVVWLLEVNWCLAAVSEGEVDEWLKIRKVDRQKKLLEVFDAVSEFRFHLEHKLPDAGFSNQKQSQINGLLEAIEKENVPANISRFFTVRIGWWRKFVGKPRSRPKIEKDVSFWLLEGIVDQILKFAGGLNLEKLSTEAMRAKLIGDEYTSKEYKLIGEWRNPPLHAARPDQTTSADDKPQFDEVSKVVCRIIDALQFRCIEQGIGTDEILEVLRLHVDDCIAATNRSRPRLRDATPVSDDHSLSQLTSSSDKVASGFDTTTRTVEKILLINSAEPSNHAAIYTLNNALVTGKEIASSHKEGFKAIQGREETKRNLALSQGNSSGNLDGSGSNPPPSNGQPGGASGGGDSRPTDDTNQPESQQGGSNSNFSGSAGDRPAGNVQNNLENLKTGMDVSSELSQGTIYLGSANMVQPVDDSQRSTGTGMVLPSSGAMGGHKNQAAGENMQPVAIVNNFLGSIVVITDGHPQNLSNKQSTSQSYLAQNNGSGDNLCIKKLDANIDYSKE